MTRKLNRMSRPPVMCTMLNYHSASMMYWSDVTTDTIHRANMDGSNEEILVNTNLMAVGEYRQTPLFSDFERSMIFRRYCCGLGVW